MVKTPPKRYTLQPRNLRGEMMIDLIEVKGIYNGETAKAVFIILDSIGSIPIPKSQAIFNFGEHRLLKGQPCSLRLPKWILESRLKNLHGWDID